MRLARTWNVKMSGRRVQIPAGAQRFKVHATWRRVGAGLGGAFVGAALGTVMGFAATYVGLVAFDNLLGFGDQDGLIILAGGPIGAIYGAVLGFLVGLEVRNVGGWVLGALVGMGLWAPLFLWPQRQTLRSRWECSGRQR
jgi:hypothetical protein